MEDPRNSRRNHARWKIDQVRYQLDRPFSPKRDIRHIGEILRDVVDGLEEPVSEDLLVLRNAWPDLVGVQIAAHSQPFGLNGPVLVVGIDHPGWLPELERIKRPLLGKLQSGYPGLRIRNVHFFLRHR